MTNQTPTASDYTAAAALRVLDDHPQLHNGGYGPLPAHAGYQLDQAESRAAIMQPESLTVILRVADWCSTATPPNIKKKNSYGLKHDAERDIDQYVSNGQLIAGMVLAGYEIRERDYNPCFKVRSHRATPERNSGSLRRGKLTIDERRLVDDLGESFKAFGRWPTTPETISIDLAARAAEQAYRRGVVQGAHLMLWHLHPDSRTTSRRPAFLDRLDRWRARGRKQEHVTAELPPEGNSPCRWTR